MIELLLIAVFCLAVLGALLFAGIEAATLAVNRKTLRERLREAGEESDRTFVLVSDTQRALDVALMGVNICAVIGALALHRAVRGLVPAGPIPGVSLLVVVVILAPLFLFATDVLARSVIRRHAAGFLLLMRAPMRLSVAMMVPLLSGCAKVAGWASRPFGVEKPLTKRRMTIDEISEMIGQPPSTDPSDVSETDMIHGAMDLESANVREVMRPLVDVIAVKIPESTVGAVLDLARATGYSRFPVFRRRIIEMTEYVDVTPLLSDGITDGPLTPYLKSAAIVPETMRIDLLLRTFTEERRRCAIVVDEFGGVVGWVTREDVLEEIVGEIADKDGDEEPGWRRLESGAYRVEARMDLDDLNEQIGTQLAKGDEFDTLGGWIYTTIGRIPDPGDAIEADGVRATVIEMDAHRILTTDIELVEEPRNGHS